MCSDSEVESNCSKNMKGLTEEIAMQKLHTFEIQMDIKKSEGPDKDPFIIDNDQDVVLFTNPIASCNNPNKSHSTRQAETINDLTGLIF